MTDTPLSLLGLAATGIGSASMIAAGSAVALAYMVYGVTGFGASIVAIPILTQLIPLRSATPVMLLLDLSAGLLIGAFQMKSVRLDELRKLGPWLAGGLLFGVTVLVTAPERPLKLLLGVFLIAYAGWRLLSRDDGRTLAAAWAVPLGLSGGCLTGVFGTGGPLYTIYVAGRVRDHDERRATLSTLITLTAFARLGLFGASGLYANARVLPLAAWLLPCGAIGLLAGARLRRVIPRDRILKLVWMILIAAGCSLLVGSLGIL